MCVIKDDNFIFCLATSFVASASMMPEPATESHGYSTPFIRGHFVSFWVARESLTIADPYPAVYGTRQNLTMC
jgi:hypothetical protein